jgi:hypothetical protein
MDQKQMAKADFVISIFLICVSLFIMLYTVFSFPRFAQWGGIYSNPGFTPFLLGFVLLIMSGYLLFRSLKQKGQEIRAKAESISNFFHQGKVLRFLICLGLFVLYYALLGRIPFVINTVLYLCLSFLIFGQRKRWYLNLIIAVAASFAVYLVFVRVFLVPLP